MNPTSIRSGVGAAQESFRLGAVVHLPRRRQVVEDAALDALGDVMRIVPDDKAERQPEQEHLCSLRSLAVQVASIVQHDHAARSRTARLLRAPGGRRAGAGGAACGASKIRGERRLTRRDQREARARSCLPRLPTARVSFHGCRVLC
eukprot:scaffold14382_cov111-Isochrysis_galbana.AAC.1